MGLRSKETPSLSSCFEALQIDDRAWLILTARYGLGRRKTLAEIGKSLGLTRERIRQIEEKSVLRLSQRLSYLAPALELLEREVTGLWDPFKPGASKSLIYSRCRDIFRETTYGEEETDAYYLLTIAMRAAGEEAWSCWPKLSFAACALPEPINDHRDVAKEVERRSKHAHEQSRTWSYRELAETVLEAAGEALHWSAIARDAERLGHRKNFSERVLFNELQRNSEVFVRVAQGTYGLAEWGLSQAPYHIAVIARVLQDAGRPLSIGEIYQGVNAIRTIKKTSLTLHLAMHPRIYESVEGAYGLRAWLPARERQTLRIPRYLVEDQDSFKRVARSEQKGYDVKRIISEDIASSSAAEDHHRTK